MFCGESLFASSDFSFKRYQVENGLSHNTVWCAIQDKYGFLWIGTSDGLNRYDGRGNKVYRNDLNDDYSLGNNFVSSLLEVGEDIWIGTNNGLYIYNRSIDRFSFFKKLTEYGVFISSEVKKIVKTQNGHIWIATLGQGVFIYDPIKDVLLQNSLQASFTWDICQGKDQRVYASTMQEGLLCFDEKGTFLQSVSVLSDKSVVNLKINCLQSVGDEIWFSAGTNLLGCYREKNKTIETYDTSSFNFGSILCLLKYDSNELLLGTNDGLYLFDRIRKVFRRGDGLLGLSRLSDSTINAMMWDAENTLWVMTNSGGVNYMPKQMKRFRYYSPTDVMGSGKEVGPLCEDKDGNIWVGTRNGLWLFNVRTRTFSEIKLGRNQAMEYDIRSLLLENSRLWIGTYAEGLHVLDLVTGAVKSYKHSRYIPNTICSNDVLSICKDKKGDIFVGTSWGLCRYSPQLDNFITITNIGSMISVTKIHEDIQNNLWIATGNNGVFRYNTQSGHWRHFEHVRGNATTITSNSVISLFEDVRGVMWFGTNGGGLCSFSKEDEAFIDFDPQHMILPNKVIYSIEQDQSGDFWVSSNAGLFRVNPIAKEHFRLFTMNDGLQGNQFTAQSSLKTSKGTIYFGGINGLNAFDPSEFTDNNYAPPVYVTDITLPNVTDEQAVKKLLQLDKPLYLSQRIQLPYDNNSFTIRFVALSYEDPAQNEYTYILKGVDKEKIETTANTASYTNLPPGEYEFVVYGSNNDRYWNDKPTSLWIVITPPWWGTTFAYIVYTLLFLGLAFYAAWRWNRHVRIKYKRRMEDYQAEKEKEMYKSKISFFINLVHEIRTPLSLIRLPLEKLQEHKHEDRDAKYLSVIDKNVNYLLGITNQLLDFQKMESGMLHLNFKECNIKGVVNDVYSQFTSPAELKGLELMLTLPEDEVRSVIDREKVSKILVNLMSNAIKYARTYIELKLVAGSEKYEICVKDDGVGIPAAQKAKIFEAFYQLPDDKVAATTGTGIGLAFAKSLAEAHDGSLRLADNAVGGSLFILSLPFKVCKTEDVVDLVEVQTAGDEPFDATSSDFSGKRFTILLVEDNVDLLNLTRESLAAWFKVLKAYNGREALQILKEESVDVIVSDVMMPEMNGLELCREVKSNIESSHIPVIMLTAKTALESKIEGLECGADVYIEKPFSIKQLYMQIENLLRLRQSFHKLMISLSGNTTYSTNTVGLSQKDCEFLARMQEVITEQLADESFSIDTLAEQMHMSRSNFYRKIKALSGISPNDYLKTIRMNKAAELIMGGTRISEVSVRVGFISSSYFAKCFKAQYGVLPKDYTGQPPISGEDSDTE